MSDWYVIATVPKGEASVERGLKRLGLGSFVPWHLVETRRGGKRRCGRYRLFPGYVFVEDRGGLPWHDVRDVWGVHGVLARDGVPERVRPHEIGDLVQGEITGAFDIRLPDPFRPGVIVKALSGAFATFCGQIAERTAEDRISVLFTLLGKQVPAEISIDAVEFVD